MKNSIAASMPEDLAHILSHTEFVWEEIRGKNIFITGGTGFFGKWFLESFIYANQQLALNASLTVLTRDSKKFLKQHPYFQQHDCLSFMDGDIRDFKFFDAHFDFIIHAATEASVRLNQENPLLMWETIVFGTRRILDFALHSKARKILLLSSGAVYGPSNENDDLHESYSNYPLNEKTSSAYAYGKMTLEQMGILYQHQYGIEVKIARCFAFVGPYLPLDSHFAVGNFIYNAIRQEPIVIKGDGKALRSYLYASDLIIWLWTILIMGKAGEVYNVGSDRAISIKELAQLIAMPNIEKYVSMMDNNILNSNNSYIPNISKLKNTLNLTIHIGLKKALEKTIKWNRDIFYENQS